MNALDANQHAPFENWRIVATTDGDLDDERLQELARSLKLDAHAASWTRREPPTALVAAQGQPGARAFRFMPPREHPSRTSAAVRMLDPASAARLRPEGEDEALLAACGQANRIDLHVLGPRVHWSAFRLMAFDMDSTLIDIECVDELADFTGRKAQVAAFTEAAMRGEIPDYDESLRRRVALLAGIDEADFESVWTQRLRLNPGARALLGAARRRGMMRLLVSGGFTWFTDRLGQDPGFDRTRSNTLGRDPGGRLDGTVQMPIVNARIKRETVLALCDELGCTPEQAIVTGDGANDLEMMSVAGLSVAYRAKPAVQARAMIRLNHSGLDALIAILDGAQPTG